MASQTSRISFFAISARYTTPTGHYPVATQLKHAARFERGDSSEVKLKKLEIPLSAAGSAALVDIPLLAALLSLPTERFYASPVLTPQRQRDLTKAPLIDAENLFRQLGPPLYATRGP
jgi:hypothetical protein